MRILQNAVVVITGASSGIGMATALALARRGARLVLAARNRSALEKVADECRSIGAEAIVVPTDVTDAAAMSQLAKTAVHQFGGRIDIWVNNAGVGALGEFAETPIEAHDQVIRTNLMGYLHGAHAVLPYFMAQKSGVIINVNSLGAWVPAPYAVAYSASKFGLRGFSAALRGELSRWPDIHVCDVFPAFIDTPGFSHAANYVGKKIKPLPPLYDPREVARAIVALAQRPRSAVTVGASATCARIAFSLFPSFITRGMEQLTRQYFRRAKVVAQSSGNLFGPPADEPSIDGGWKHSNPRIPAQKVGALMAGAALGFLLLRGYAQK